MPILERTQSLALKLRPLRLPIWILLVLCIAVIVYALSNIHLDRRWEQFGFLGGTWSVLLLTLIYGFSYIPPPSDAGWWRRVGRSIHRGLYLIVAGVTLIASAAFILLTLRLLIHA